MNFFRPSFDPSCRDMRDESIPHPSATPTEVGVQYTSANLHEAMMDSVSSARDSLPEQYRAHFETLRQEIIDFTKAHGIPKESLSKPDLLREVTDKLSIPDLERLADLLERFEYLLKNGEPKKEELPKHLQEIERLYNLREQYTSQVSLLEQVGILKEGVITGVDGHEYPVPTLEQIAVRLFERRETLQTKRDQGFTKLLLVPFGMSLDTLCETLKRFLLSYKQRNSLFNIDKDVPLGAWKEERHEGVNIEDSIDLVYYPQFLTKEGHGGKTKIEILEEQKYNRDSFPGWTIHLFQPSDPANSDSKGFALIPRRGEGKVYGEEGLRFEIETGHSAPYYLALLEEGRDDPDFIYSQESGMTPEDWIMAFMIHLEETGRPLDNWQNSKESISCLIGSFSVSDAKVPLTFWMRIGSKVLIGNEKPNEQNGLTGIRTSVLI